MRSYHVTLGLAAMALLGGITACNSTPASSNDLGTATSDLRRNPDLVTAVPKGVYTMSNDVADNQIFVFARAADGTLTMLNSYTTGGKGTGVSLGNQNGLIFDSAMNMFFAVNAGDNSISMLALKSDGTLTLLYKILSGGVKPVSITETGGVVYVVNAGDNFMAANIAGFQVSGSTLVPIANSIKPLSGTASGAMPAQIQFAPGGATLVVTEKATSKIDTYTVAAGVATGPTITNSNGTTPFGFAFSANQKLIVSEAVSGSANKGTVSSYAIGAGGALTTVSNQLPSMQTSPCWVVVAGNNAYVSNATSGTISAFGIGADGLLTLLANGNSGTTGMAPTDEAVTEANDYLYVLNSGSHSLSIFAVSANGTLTRKPQDFPGLPANASGLVAR